MSKHTKGPWLVGNYPFHILNNSKTGTYGLLAEVKHGPQVDGSGDYGFSESEAWANAVLISEAPELLKALQTILSKCNEVSESKDTALLNKTINQISEFAYDYLAHIARKQGDE